MNIQGFDKPTQQMRPASAAPIPRPQAVIRCALLTAFLSSCTADLPLQRHDQEGEDSRPAVLYSIVLVVHGDGDYLYHDTNGNAYNADEEVLAEARRIALHNTNAEFFIFHQRTRERFLFLFPLHDGEFWYYRNGELTGHELYWRDQRRFDPEVALYHHFGARNQPERVAMFLYYGHEIPEFGGAGYDASSPDRMFTLRDLEMGLKGFTRNAPAFDLMILSTCYGGTPHTIGRLASFARYIIASPENLHLSYIDLHPLENMDLALQDGDVAAFAEVLARQAFERLSGDIQTAVSVAVYDANRVQEYSRSIHPVYEKTLFSLQEKSPIALATLERCDCGDIEEYVLPALSNGVEVFYRPAHFGRSKLKKQHSGWECWRTRDGN